MTQKEKINEIIKALGSFIWLGNNLHNYHTREFLEMLYDAIQDAREAYSLALELEQETK